MCFALQEMGAEPVTSVAGLFEHQYVSLHVPLTDETKASINKAPNVMTEPYFGEEHEEKKTHFKHP